MSVKILVDMNLSPSWVPLLKQNDWSVIHWSEVGNPRATDAEIMNWASSNGYIVFTHDLDFGTLLASTSRQWSQRISSSSEERLAAVGPDLPDGSGLHV